jgi:hypothetical protein
MNTIKFTSHVTLGLLMATSTLSIPALVNAAQPSSFTVAKNSTELLDFSSPALSSTISNSGLSSGNLLAQAGVNIFRKGDSGNQAGTVSEIATTYSYGYGQTITAVRTAEGTLKLIGWRVNGNGSVSRTGDSGDQAGQATQIDIASGRLLVTAVRTASGDLKLISWSVGNTGNINRSGDSGNQAGTASLVKIMQIHSDVFVTAVRTAEGNLKLISWRLNPDGSLTRLNDSGNAAGAVSEIALSGESLNNRRHVITSVRDGQGNLKLIAWEVSPNGTITRRGDSGSQAGNARMIRAEKAGQYTVTAVRTASGDLKLISWALSQNSNGGVSIARAGDSGNQAGAIQDNALLARPNGAVSAVKTASGDLKLIRWRVSSSGAIARIGDSGDQAGSATLVNISPNPNSSQVPMVTAVRTAQNTLKLITWDD